MQADKQVKAPDVPTAFEAGHMAYSAKDEAGQPLPVKNPYGADEMDNWFDWRKGFLIAMRGSLR